MTFQLHSSEGHFKENYFFRYVCKSVLNLPLGHAAVLTDKKKIHTDDLAQNCSQLIDNMPDLPQPCGKPFVLPSALQQLPLMKSYLISAVVSQPVISCISTLQPPAPILPLHYNK